MPNPRVQNAIRQTRTEKGMTQQQLAELTGLARQSIISIEKLRFIPTIENALRLALALDVPVEDLFWLKDGSK
ncbi:MAG TPA: helix-turn-helix transcriptional regulator [Anaerolineales bacterium]|nr:helix-turn-helix transcriptional regulator [Anaerolineales bacterium]